MPLFLIWSPQIQMCFEDFLFRSPAWSRGMREAFFLGIQLCGCRRGRRLGRLVKWHHFLPALLIPNISWMETLVFILRSSISIVNQVHHKPSFLNGLWERELRLWFLLIHCPSFLEFPVPILGTLCWTKDPPTLCLFCWNLLEAWWLWFWFWSLGMLIKPWYESRGVLFLVCQGNKILWCRMVLRSRQN